MADQPVTQQFRRRFNFIFLFRIGPGFFVGLAPRRRGPFAMGGGYPGWGGDYDDYDDGMVIRRIDQTQYTFLQRIGISEVQVMDTNY
jgi:hypothetical protein